MYNAHQVFNRVWWYLPIPFSPSPWLPEHFLTLQAPVREAPQQEWHCGFHTVQPFCLLFIWVHLDTQMFNHFWSYLTCSAIVSSIQLQKWALQICGLGTKKAMLCSLGVCWATPSGFVSQYSYTELSLQAFLFPFCFVSVTQACLEFILYPTHPLNLWSSCLYPVKLDGRPIPPG